MQFLKSVYVFLRFDVTFLFTHLLIKNIDIFLNHHNSINYNIKFIIELQKNNSLIYNRPHSI